jgi:hypothetical protein
MNRAFIAAIATAVPAAAAMLLKKLFQSLRCIN